MDEQLWSHREARPKCTCGECTLFVTAIVVLFLPVLFIVLWNSDDESAGEVVGITILVVALILLAIWAFCWAMGACYTMSYGVACYPCLRYKDGVAVKKDKEYFKKTYCAIIDEQQQQQQQTAHPPLVNLDTE